MNLNFIREVVKTGSKLSPPTPALAGRLAKKNYRFSDGERQTIKKFVEALLFTAEGELPERQFQWFIPEFEEHLASMEGLPGFLMALLPQLIESFPLLTGTAAKKFSKLDFSARQECLRKIEESNFPPLLTAFILAKTFAFAVFFDNPETHEMIQFDKKCKSE